MTAKATLPHRLDGEGKGAVPFRVTPAYDRGNREADPMNRAMLASLLALTAAEVASAAPERACIDTKQSYIARPLNNNQIYVETSFGAKKPPVRLTTSCHHLQSAIGFGLSSEFSCIDQGDIVVATLSGERQFCVVTKVEPYAAAKDDLPVKAEKSQ